MRWRKGVCYGGGWHPASLPGPSLHVMRKERSTMAVGVIAVSLPGPSQSSTCVILISIHAPFTLAWLRQRVMSMKTALIIDDDPLYRTLMAEILGQTGWKTFTA